MLQIDQWLSVTCTSGPRPSGNPKTGYRFKAGISPFPKTPEQIAFTQKNATEFESETVTGRTLSKGGLNASGLVKGIIASGRVPLVIGRVGYFRLTLPNTSFSKSVTRAAGLVRIFFSSCPTTK